MLTLFVDFNTTRDGVVRGRRSPGSDGDAETGTLALLDDGEGNLALGTVSRIAGDLVFAEVDWTTWNRIVGRTLIYAEAENEGPTTVAESRLAGLVPA